MTHEELNILRQWAEESQTVSPAHWKSHSKLMKWFKTDPLAVIECIQATKSAHDRPSGLATQRLIQALKNLPSVVIEIAENGIE
jgi:hypothetical protein